MHLVNKFIYIIGLFFILPLCSIAQRNEVSINLSAFGYGSRITDTSEQYKQNAKGFNFHNTLCFTSIMKNDHLWEAGIGYEPNKQYGKVTKKMTNGVFNLENIEKSNRLVHTFSAMGRYGYCSYFQKLQLRSSFRFSIKYIDLGDAERSIENIDSVGNIGAYVKNTISDGYNVNLGAFVSQSFIYPIYKRILFGVDFNIGINNDNYFGAQTYAVESLNNGIYSSTKETLRYEKLRKYYLHFYPNISVRYAFGK
jgi:hypothetical protein